ncbi:MAG TPA: type II CAAX endopeptidase family protein, partial [Acidimicrobiales bacterium]
MSEPDQALIAPDDERVPVRWGLGDAAAGWLLAQVGGFIAIVVVAVLSGTHAESSEDLSLGWLAVAQLGLWAGLGGVPWLAARLKGNGVVADFGFRAKVVDPAIGLGVGLGTQFILVPALYIPIFWIFNVTTNELEEPARGLTDRATDPFGVVLLVLIVGIGAPIIEELFYRGLLLRALERRFSVSWVPVAISAVLFAASHFEPLQFPALALLGAILAVLVQRTGRLGPAIATHMVFNLTTVTF